MTARKTHVSPIWYVDPLVGNDCEKKNDTTAIAKYRLRKEARFHSNNGSDGFYTVRAEVL
jgi:hypothetical protein